MRAVWRGLSLAKEMQAQRVWLQTDSNVIVNMLAGRAHSPPELRVTLQKCLRLMEWTGWEVKCTHCFREANQVADILANMGSDGSVGVTIHRSPPRGVLKPLYAHSSGVYWPRHYKSSF